MPDEQRSYVIFLPKSLDLEKRRAHGNIKIIHEGTHSENMELSFSLNSEEANGIEVAIRRAAERVAREDPCPPGCYLGVTDLSGLTSCVPWRSQWASKRQPPSMR